MKERQTAPIRSPNIPRRKPFQHELEEKIRIGIDHDFIGYHNRKSGNVYSSNEAIHQKIRHYQSHNELVNLEKQLNLRTPRLPQSDYIGDEPFWKSLESKPFDVKPVVLNKFHKTYRKKPYQAIPENNSNRNVHATRYHQLKGTDFTAIPRAHVSSRREGPRPTSSYAIF